MAWVQLGEAGLEGVDAVLHERMMRHTGTAGSAVKRAGPPVAPQVGGEVNPLRIGEKIEARADGLASLPPLWMVRTNHGGVGRNGRADTAKTGKPHPAARLFLATVNGVRVGHSTGSKSAGAV